MATQEIQSPKKYLRFLKPFLILSLLLVFHRIAAQPDLINLRIFSEDLIPLHNAYAMAVKDKSVFFPNTDGHLVFKVNRADTIVVISMGYISEEFLAEQLIGLDSIILRPSFYMLNEVTIYDFSSMQAIVLGNEKGKSKCSVHGRIRTGSFNDEMGLHMQSDKRAVISEVNFYVSENSTVGSHFRIKVYKIENTKKALIYNGNPQEIECQKCWQTVNLKNEYPEVNGNFFVAIEWLISDIAQKRYLEERFPAGFAIGKSANVKIRRCMTDGITYNKLWHSTCCGYEDGDGIPMNLMLHVKVFNID